MARNELVCNTEFWPRRLGSEMDAMFNEAEIPWKLLRHQDSLKHGQATADAPLSEGHTGSRAIAGEGAETAASQRHCTVSTRRLLRTEYSCCKKEEEKKS